jgi:hypothetical protein
MRWWETVRLVAIGWRWVTKRTQTHQWRGRPADSRSVGIVRLSYKYYDLQSVKIINRGYF